MRPSTGRSRQWRFWRSNSNSKRLEGTGGCQLYLFAYLTCPGKRERRDTRVMNGIDIKNLASTPLPRLDGLDFILFPFFPIIIL
jgi:hypothetical protein